MEWVIAGAGAVLSASLQVLFDRMASRQFITLFQRQKLDDKTLKKLKLTLLSVNAVLDDAEEKQITNPAVKDWLDELQDAVYHAEDLLDEIDTEALRCQLEANSQTNANQNTTSTSLTPSYNEGIKVKAEEIIKKLEYVAEQKYLLGLKEGMRRKWSQRLPTTSLVDEFDVCGRDEDKKEIINMLKSNDACGNEICVITLVGMGGIGKTTLAQLVYNDVKDFHVKAWVWVSEEFDMLRVTKTILEAVTWSACDLMDLNLLLIRLKASLTKKKFLFVLDDVWEQNYIDWDVLRSAFTSAAKGSKIIVTTRNKSVGSIMRTSHTHYLKELPYEDCWTLFAKRAFENGNPSSHPNLEAIGKKIVKKCKGLPLAIKTLGGLLYSKVEAWEWVSILNSEIWDLPNGKSNILPALRLSYYYLPSHLKRCFAYCSIFSKGHEFEKEKLVLLWMAEGFVLPAKSKRREEVGDEYFRELLSRSFFQQSSCNKSCFVMHDLISDLAQFVSGEFCFKLEDGKSHEVSVKARHMWYLRDEYDVVKISEALYEVKYLRTFLPSNLPSYNALHPQPLNDIVSHALLPKLRCLRVLSLPSYWISELPKEIGDLKHLRYLDLSHTAIKELPDTTSSLYNLQTLMLSGCLQLTKLPPNMRNLINLRHLNISGTRLEKMPMQFSRLKGLQTLSIFVVSRDSGSRISELGELLHLGGRLTISKLQNVVSATDASEANLKNKEYLEELVLKWDPDSGGLQNVTDGLNKLRPHENLKRLTISDYGGTSFPDWLGDASFSNIVFLHLGNCHRCSSLPPLSQLASLRELSINGMKGVKRVDPEFYGRGSSSIKPFGSLEILRFQDMSELEQFSFGCEGGEFPSLRELYILRCPKLTGNLPDHLPSLVKLVISKCQQLVASIPSVPALRELELNCCDALKFLPGEMMHGNGCLQHLGIAGSSSQISSCTGGLPTTLNSLRIFKCRKLELQLPKKVMHHHTSLKRLHIESSCDSLSSFPLGFFTKLEDLCILDCGNLELLWIQEELHEDLTFLHNLEIRDCPNLESFPGGGLPTPNLTLFSVSNCKKLKSMPKCMHSLLTSLQSLDISHCPELMSFPEGGLPSNLESLSIDSCDKLMPQMEWGLHRMASLGHFSIEGGCSNVESFPEEGLLPTNLAYLRISGLSNLRSLDHNGLQLLTSLETLEINSCNNLQSMPGGRLPTTLSSLIIGDCSLLKPRCQRDIGEDWLKISHIPYINIDGVTE